MEPTAERAPTSTPVENGSFQCPTPAVVSGGDRRTREILTAVLRKMFSTFLRNMTRHSSSGSSSRPFALLPPDNRYAVRHNYFLRIVGFKRTVDELVKGKAHRHQHPTHVDTVGTSGPSSLRTVHFTGFAVRRPRCHSSERKQVVVSHSNTKTRERSYARPALPLCGEQNTGRDVIGSPALGLRNSSDEI
ncbi:hypothetical protein F2P81_025411 [Scophthalmus maximus]|uniref:Uncharacterized protein n=1 Tax=Scophthalmus maximus TaxID=52904 RepID=A0A6A4RIP3_SCOMX|nr:hypothetical protein F2P81_025411 [Scophthalmus maximus]